MRSRLAVLLLAGGLGSLPLLAPIARGDPPRPVPGPSAVPKEELVERILAVVNERPLLLSEVRAFQALRGIDRALALEAAIDERLMYQEAARLPQADVSAEEEDRALHALLEKRPALGKEVEEAELWHLLRRQLAILKYVEFRFRPQLGVTDEAVRQAFETDQAGTPGTSPVADRPAFEDAAPEIRARLERRALDERIEAWVKELRNRADLRYVGESPAGGKPPSGP